MLFGRDRERDAIGELLDAARHGRSGALVLRGEPGAGKTALLEDALDRAADMQVLTARGIESESELPFAGLHQLVRPALDLIDRLPPPQAMALRGALGLAERAGDERFLISAACLTLLSELSERRPVVCLVDDVQWLDVPSTDALLFVARRLGAEGVVMLLSAREGDGSRFEAPGLPGLAVGPLDPAAAADLIEHRARSGIAAPVRDLIVGEAAGNALALVELPAGLTPSQLSGEEPLPEALPLTRDVERLFLQRVHRLPEPTQRLLTLVAADDGGLLAPVLQAAETEGIDSHALAAAEHAGLVDVSGSRIDMRHPLVRSAIYQGASSGERRAAHLALARVLSDDQADRRAWHRAAASLGPDDDLADELERTADRARRRSGHAAAATALERAVGVTADPIARGRRLVAAATAAWQAGQPDRAARLLARAEPDVTDPVVRAEADHVRGEMDFRCGRILGAGRTLIDGAATVAAIDPGKALAMLFDAANAGLDGGDYALLAEACARAAALPRDGDGGEMIGMLADLLSGVGEIIGGGPGGPDAVPMVQSILARSDSIDEPRWLVWAAVGAGAVGDMALERELLRRAVLGARASARADALTLVHISIAVEGVISGRFEVTAEAEEGLALARDARFLNAESVYRAVLAWFAAIGGDDRRCGDLAAEAVRSAGPNGVGLACAVADWAVAMSDLAGGRHEDAARRLDTVGTAGPGAGQPYIGLVSTADRVEAWVRAGRRDRAEAAFAVLDGFAVPGAPAWVRALAERCQGLLGDGAAAERGFADALELHGEHDRPFDRARSELLLGEHLRRARRRVDAREHLRAALTGFEALAATPWAERARQELRATGETARRRDPDAATALTPQEHQIARLVAQGLTNKEVAAQLFLSPRTIDAHLRGVFAKLGITSRRELRGVGLGAIADEPALT